MDPNQLLAVMKLLNTLAGSPELAGMPVDRNISMASVGEAGEAITKCYHPSGRFRAAEVVSRYWPGAGMYSAEKSAVVRVYWTGALLGTRYTTDVALLERQGMIRTYLISDNAMVPANNRCWLESWVRPQ